MNYIPGIRFVDLVHKQPTPKEAGLKNSVTSAFKAEQIVFSIGEIDFRYYKKLLLSRREFYKHYKSKIYKLVDIAVEKLARQVPVYQFVKFIVPPVNLSDLDQGPLREKVKLEFDQLCSYFKEKVIDTGSGYIEYDQNVRKSIAPEFIDHAHFSLPIYAQLLRTLESENKFLE